MKKNRLLSAFLAGALMVSAMPFQAFAAPGADIVNPSSGGTIGGESTVVSQAEVRVVVPGNTDFLVNPLELDVTGVSDQIISTPFVFINKSNMDVQLSVSPEFTSDSGVTVAASADEIKDTIGEAPTIFLQVAPATAKPTLTGSGDTLDFDTTSTPVFTSGEGISTTVTEEADGVTPNATYFKLKNIKSAYSVDTSGATPVMKFDKSLVIPDDTDAVAVKFIGKVSQMSNWTGITPKVKFHYEFNLISKEAYADTDNEVSGAHGLVNKNLAVTGPSISFTSDGAFAFSIPNGYKIAGGIAYITSDGPFSVSAADIKAAVEEAVSTDSVVVGAYTIKKLDKLKYVWDSDSKTGQLGSQVLTNSRGRHMHIITYLVNEEDATDIVAVVSPDVVIGG